MRPGFPAIGLALIAFVWMNAQIAESVGSVQLDRAYTCYIDGAACRGSFGNIHIIRRAP